jgi:hypothetical protein
LLTRAPRTAEERTRTLSRSVNPGYFRGIDQPRPMRGIAPETLVAQVRSTMPYLFDGADAALASLPPARVVLDIVPGRALSHAEYFALCLSAHYLTCATLVPTDVDNAIRLKLWPEGLPLATALEMGALVVASHDWDFTPLGARVCMGAPGSAWADAPLHGHFGEWFTVACAAYAALGRYRAAEAKTLREQLFAAIVAECERHAQIFGSLWRAKDGLGALRATATIAHNFGDLDRVMEMWALPVADPLRVRCGGLTTRPFDAEGALRLEGRLWTAGELYKATIDGSSMALENHRHFALRKPRVLRSTPALRVPLGPFFDAWGEEVARRVEGEALDEVITALVEGSERLPKTVGYGRALAGIVAARPEARTAPALAKLAKAPRVKALFKESRADFEARWAGRALALLDEIPSRA